MEGIVTSLLSWKLLGFCVVLGEGFESKYKPYFTWKMAEKFACYSVGIIILFFVVFCPSGRLQLSTRKLKIVGTTSFLTTSWWRLDAGPNKASYPNSLFEAVFVKVLYINVQMLWGGTLSRLPSIWLFSTYLQPENDTPFSPHHPETLKER